MSDTVQKTKTRGFTMKQRIAIYGGLLLFATVYVCVFWCNHLYAGPVELYHRAWAGVRDHLFDRDALRDWPSYEHKYDGQIRSDAQAVEFFNKAVESTGDPFTKLLDAAQMHKQLDAHAGFYSGVGMTLNGKRRPIVVRGLIPGSPAEKAGVRRGDQVISVDGLDCQRLPAYKVGDYTREHMGSSVSFTLRRDGKPIVLAMVPARIPVESIHSKWLDKNTAYVRIENFLRTDIATMVRQEFAKYEGASGLVLDLRANPGGDVDSCLETAALMLDKGNLVVLRSQGADGKVQTIEYKLTGDSINVATSQQGQYSVQPRRRFRNMWGSKPIVVLVDDGSASSAEMLAGALQDNHRALLLGTRTYGKGVMQIVLPMPNNSGLSVTSGRYYTPSGRWLGDGREVENNEKRTAAKEIERGLAPDITVTVPDTVEFAKPGDSQVEAALKFLNDPATRKEKADTER